jgi:IS1 family transposase
VDGASIRATVRMTGVAKNTIVKLLADVGRACDEYQHRVLRNLPCRRVQADEIWSFCYGKQKNLPADKQNVYGYGDVWTWVAIDAETKLVPCWMLSHRRQVDEAIAFIRDLAARLRNRVQLTTDGLGAYVVAVDEAFGGDVDFSQLIKVYGQDIPSPETRYSPSICKGTRKRTWVGDPDEGHISTSFIERQNLTMRMGMRRFTRLTNAFSKKVQNHAHAIALHFMNYNFCRIHQTLRVTPAMAAGVTTRVWSIEDVLAMVDGAQRESAAA